MPRNIIVFIIGLALAGAACTKDPAVTPKAFPREPVRVVGDKNGIPHIYAKNDADAFFAQGYVMAELRPSQSEIWRLYSQGRRSEVLGESKLTTDYFVRSMDFLGFAHRNWRGLRAGWPYLAEGFEAFAAGFNRKYAEYQAEGWPSTLQVMIDAGWQPTPWTPQEAFAIAQLLGFGLAGSPDIKIEITLLKAFLGPSLFDDLIRIEPPAKAFTMPHFFDGPGFERKSVKAAAPAAPEGDPLAALVGDKALLTAVEKVRELAGLRFGGSNSFSMAGSKMTDGIAVLESDTHQGLPVPGPYVLFHLISSRGAGATGNLDLLGSAFPGAPMVVFGHNGKVAWAPTVGFSDVADFYFERSDPEDPSRVLRPGGISLPTTVRHEQFKIRRDDGGFRYQTVAIRDIPGHGPILPSEILPLPIPLKISIRWAGAELPGPSAAVYNLGLASKLDDMFGALRTLKGGTIGFGLATTENRTAYSLWTHHPKRKADGVFKPWMIIPGWLGPHWDGFIPHEQLPHWIDPTRGYLWTANNDPVGATLDNDPGNDPLYLGFAYALGYRGQRLDDLLGALAARGNVTMNELERVEVDRHSLFADQLMPYFANAVSRNAALFPAWVTPYVAAVFEWDRRAEPDSHGATIFYAWAHQFVADMLIDDFQMIDEVGGSTLPIMAPALFHWLEKTQPIIDGIDAGTVKFPSKSGVNLFDDRNTAHRIETRDVLIAEAVTKAVEHLKATFSAGTNGDPAADPDDLTTWHLSRILFLRSRHALAEIDPAWEKYDQFRGMGGNVDTVYVGQYAAWKDGKLLDRFILGNAPSNRFFWRMEPDGIRAKFQVPWGQSELPESEHYLDLVDDYVNQKFRDFPYSDDEIEAAKVSERLLR